METMVTEVNGEENIMSIPNIEKRRAEAGGHCNGLGHGDQGELHVAFYRKKVKPNWWSRKTILDRKVQRSITCVSIKDTPNLVNMNLD